MNQNDTNAANDDAQSETEPSEQARFEAMSQAVHAHPGTLGFVGSCESYEISATITASSGTVTGDSGRIELGGVKDHLETMAAGLGYSVEYSGDSVTLTPEVSD